MREKRRPIFIHVFIGDWGGRRRGEGKERRGGSKCCFNTIQITYACAFCLRLKRREKRKRRRERKNEKEEEEEVEKKGMPQCACAPFFPSFPPPLFSPLLYLRTSFYLSRGTKKTTSVSLYPISNVEREKERELEESTIKDLSTSHLMLSLLFSEMSLARWREEELEGDRKEELHTRRLKAHTNKALALLLRFGLVQWSCCVG